MRVVSAAVLILSWYGIISAQPGLAPREEALINGSYLLDSIRCTATGADTVKYSSVLQAYYPDPFPVSLTIRNNGFSAVQDVRACLRVPAGLVLANPADSCRMIAVLRGGDSVSVEWRVRIPLPLLTDTTFGMEFLVSMNGETVICRWDVHVEAFSESPLRCDIRVPDSILFRDTTYIPSEFPVRLFVWNIGKDPVFEVQALLLHDPRFNIVDSSGAFRLMADSLYPGDTIQAMFNLRVNPRLLDGVDTVRVMVAGKDLASSVCEDRIWVQHAMRPELSLTCVAEVDSLRFDEMLAEYTPNPFRVTMVITNRGEVVARRTRLFFAGPPRFTPVSGAPVVNVGNLQPGASISHTWNMKALPRTVGGIDSLVMQARGKGGYGNRPLFKECRVPLYVPASRASSYSIRCVAPDSLRFSGGRYSPDPFDYTVMITNSGQAIGRDITVTLLLPAGVELDAGETVIKTLPELQAGETATVGYRLRPIARSDTATVRICVDVKDNTGRGGTCCHDVRIPRRDVGKLEIQCSAPSRLSVDSLRGDYSPNPFPVQLMVRNTGLDVLRNLTAVILPQSPDLQVNGNPQQPVTAALIPGDSAEVNWVVTMQGRQQGGTVEIRVQVRADELDPIECVVRIFVPGLGNPLLTMFCQTTPADTLHYLNSRGDYERNPFVVSATVSNVGSMRAENVRVLMIPGNGVVLATGEVSEKPLVPVSLGMGESGTASWNVHPVPADSGALRRFTMVVNADNATETNCLATVFVVGVPKIVNLAIPADNLLQYGERILVPVLIDEIEGKRIEQYLLRIRFDESLIMCTGVVTDKSLTSTGWAPPVKREVGRGLVEITSAANPGSALTKGIGPLFYIEMEAVFGTGRQALKTARSPVRIDTADINAGAMRVRWIDGMVTVSGECVEPMNAGAGFVLFPNVPNPFNPSTQLRFRISGDRAVFTRLIVIDRLGRTVSTVVEASLQPGDHSVTFDGSGMPSGVYFVHLIIGRKVLIGKMLLMK